MPRRRGVCGLRWRVGNRVEELVNNECETELEKWSTSNAAPEGTREADLVPESPERLEERVERTIEVVP